MAKIVFLHFLSTLLFSWNESAVAQSANEKSLNPEWAQNDIGGVRFLVGLMPIENQSLAGLKAKFEKEAPYRYTSWCEEEVLGFGARRVKLSMGLGYTTVYVDSLVFRNRVLHYDAGARVAAKVSPAHREMVLRIWNERVKSSVVEDNNYDTALIYRKDFPDTWAAYYAEIRRHLGPMKLVEVPAVLKKSYLLLIDPFENSRISTRACDDGKPAIDALEDAKRVDLIENVLRGYNPGGRIYAAISLLRMERRGRRLSRATKTAIRKVVALDAETGTCIGDTGVTGLRARDIVPGYVRSGDWYLLRGRP